MEIFLLSAFDFFKSIGWQLLMFFLTGIAFELILEFIKATLYPVTRNKECPRWLGMIMGAMITVVYLMMAYTSNAKFGDAGWYIPGGYIFIPVWFILFFFYQYKAMRIAKCFRNILFPTLKDPSYVKPQKDKNKDIPLSQDQMDRIMQIVQEPSKNDE